MYIEGRLKSDETGVDMSYSCCYMAVIPKYDEMPTLVTLPEILDPA